MTSAVCVKKAAAHGGALLRRYEPPIPTRIGKRKKKSGPDVVHKLPQGLCLSTLSLGVCCFRLTLLRFGCCAVTPHMNCKLRLLKLQRIKDYLLMEE